MPLANLNWEAVVDAIAEEASALMDLEEITESVERAARRWVKDDLANCSQFGAVEKLIERTASGRHKYKGAIDLWYFKDPECVKIVDWKTVKTLNEMWEWRQERSSQGKWYALLLRMGGVEVPTYEVEFRGVLNPTAKIMKTVKQTLTMDELAEFDRNLAQWEKWFTGLSEDWTQPWPTNQPAGCRPFGPRYPCAFEDVCEGRKPYLYSGPPPVKDMSFSTLDSFKRCPERVRLQTLADVIDPTPTDKSEASSFGSAFHAGIAEVYKQIFLEEGP